MRIGLTVALCPDKDGEREFREKLPENAEQKRMCYKLVAMGAMTDSIPKLLL
jgi:hypothetical protein